MILIEETYSQAEHDFVKLASYDRVRLSERFVRRCSNERFTICHCRFERIERFTIVNEKQRFSLSNDQRPARGVSKRPVWEGGSK